MNGYKACFGHVLNADWGKCPVEFDILEQVILARNRGQHPHVITEMGVDHSGKDRQKYPMPFFISEDERKMFDAGNLKSIAGMNPPLQVTRETLFAAIDQVEMLGDWLEEQMFDAKYPRRGGSGNRIAA